MLELCKTSTKMSNPDIFNFYVVLADHDMVTDAGRTSTCKRIFNAPWLQTKVQKSKGPFIKMGFKGKTIWRFQRKKKSRNIILDLSKKIKWNTRTLKTITEYGTSNQEEVNRRKAEKSIQIETIGNLQE